MRKLSLKKLQGAVNAAMMDHGDMEVWIETAWQLFKTDTELCVDNQVDGKVFIIKGLLDESLIKKH